MKTPPERWSTRHLAAEPARDEEQRAGVLLRRAIVKQPLDASSLADVRSRLPDLHRAAPRRRALRVGFALALFLSGSGVVMSATLLGRWPVRRETVTIASGAPRPTPAAQHRTVAVARDVTTPNANTAVASTTSSPSRSAHGPRSREAFDAPDVVPPPVAAAARRSAMSEEAALLGAALRALRERDDAAGALALLDERDRQFSTAGALGDEADTTRIEALLRLGQHGRALALMDARVLSPTGRARELLASLGELRADAGRCAEARADFDALLSGDAPDDGVVERALFGRAACGARAGDAEGARADLQAYLARFPDGRFAARARASLDH